MKSLLIVRWAIVLAVVLSHTSLEAVDDVWLKKSAIPVPGFLEPFPKPGSESYLRDLEEVLRIQSTRKEEDCKRAEHTAHFSLESVFGPPAGPLTAADVEIMKPFFKRLLAQHFVFSEALKREWNRPRPFVVDPKVSPCFTHDSPAYPSGHTAAAHLFLEVLSRLRPNLQKALTERADSISWDRVVAGVHFPTDIEAGRKLGQEVAQKLFSDDRFRVEFEALRESLLRK